VRANREVPYYRAVRDLVVIVLGPAQVLGEELDGVNGLASSVPERRWRPANKVPPRSTLTCW
jgi:hypothetical protein